MPAKVEYTADVRVCNASGDLDLTPETYDLPLIGEVLGSESFQGDLAAQLKIACGVDFAHPAPPNEPLDAESAGEGFSFRQQGLRRSLGQHPLRTILGPEQSAWLVVLREKPLDLKAKAGVAAACGFQVRCALCSRQD
jgi:hypothetical protein